MNKWSNITQNLKKGSQFNSQLNSEFTFLALFCILNYTHSIIKQINHETPR
jgi:hypothetical protein